MQGDRIYEWWLLLYSLPFMALGLMMFLLNASVPFSDDLHLLPPLKHLLIDHTVAVEDFFPQVNEHLVTAPFLVMAVLTGLFGYNNHVGLLMQGVIAVVIFRLIIKLGNRLGGTTESSLPYLHLLSAVMISSLVLWEVWSHAFTLNLTIPLVAVVGAVWLLSTRPLTPWVLVGVVGLGVTASFSAIHGLGIWVALLPLLIGRRDSTLPTWLILGLWIAAAVATGSLYQVMYELVVGGTLTPVTPSFLFYFFVTTLGGAVWSIDPMMASVIGTLLLGYLGFVLWGLYRQRRLSSWMVRPWLCLIAYGLLGLVLLTIGRAGPHVIGRAFLSRYYLFSYPLVLCILYLSWAAFGQKKWANAIYRGVAIVGIAISIGFSVEAIQAWVQRSQKLEVGESCLATYQTAPADCLARLGNGALDGEFVRAAVPSLHALQGPASF